jgi:hypothetical protein
VKSGNLRINKLSTLENEMKTRNVLIDTSIVLEGIEKIFAIDRNSNVFVTDVVLRELDGNKGAEGAKGYNAREFFRQFNANKFQMLNELPFSKKSLDKNDTLTEGTISSGVHIYTIARKWYRSRDINDSRIIEIAKDYDLTLNTFDQAQCARAKSMGGVAEELEKTDIDPAGGIAFFVFIGMLILLFIISSFIQYSLDGIAYIIIFVSFLIAYIFSEVLRKTILPSSQGLRVKSLIKTAKNNDPKIGTSYVEIKMIENGGHI